MKELLKQLGFEESIAKKVNDCDKECEEGWNCECMELQKRIYLPTLSEFVKNQTNELYDENGFLSDRLKSIINYTNFITQPLTKGMFIPCDEDGNVLVEPEEPCYDYEDVTMDSSHSQIKALWDGYSEQKKQFQQALDRVLFEGWLLQSEWETGCKVVSWKGQNEKKLFVFEGSHTLDRTIEQAINNGVKLYLK